eukprot:TRINITY_DN50632_c0_g1_i1.p1 TRINITY_DN50632_c0_g1~~TRINITY_DN50632_c0_g1_i1.p1  ORF type:complete len:218 (+),score=9.98 TRINITY_DN50632_c0_g1_i1:24-656(+)
MAEIILHVRNVPCKVLETCLQDTMQEVGLDVSRYEIYFPKKPGRQGRYNNFGYGFVTCWRTEDAEAFIRTMHGFCFDNINSHKHLAVEPARGNLASEPLDEAFGRPGALDSVHAMTPVTHDRFPNSSIDCLGISTASAHFPSTYFSGSTSVAEHNAARPGAQRGPPIRSGRVVPDDSQVPPTRLAFDERFIVNSTNALVDESSLTRFCFQ